MAEKFPNVKMPEAMQWLDTGEFLTEESFFRYRDETVESGEGGMVYVSTATVLCRLTLFDGSAGVAHRCIRCRRTSSTG